MKTLYISKQAKKELNLAELKEKAGVDRVWVDPILIGDDWYMITSTE